MAWRNGIYPIHHFHCVNRTGQVVLKLKTPYRNGATHIVMSPMEFMQRRLGLRW